MIVALIAILLLLACVGAIYLLLRNMGEEGIEVAAPASCKAGRCGVRNGTADSASCRAQGERLAEESDPPMIAAESGSPAGQGERDSRAA